MKRSACGGCVKSYAGATRNRSTSIGNQRSTSRCVAKHWNSCRFNVCSAGDRARLSAGQAPHLAGALARPVWMLLKRDADWRWMQDRDDSPWYPTMRLFRQSREGHWASVTHAVSDALRGACEASGSAVSAEAAMMRTGSLGHACQLSWDPNPRVIHREL